MRTLPIDEEASMETGYSIRYWDDGFTEKNADYFRIDLLLKLRRNKARYTSEWSIDIMNLLNRRNMLSEYWENGSNEISEEYQNPIIGIVSYRIQF